MVLWVEVYKCKAGLCETNIFPQNVILLVENQQVKNWRGKNIKIIKPVFWFWKNVFNTIFICYFLLYFVTNGDFFYALYFTHSILWHSNRQRTVFKDYCALEVRLTVSSAGQCWPHVIVQLFGSKYKQTTITYFFTPDPVSPCCPLAVALHSLGHPTDTDILPRKKRIQPKDFMTIGKKPQGWEDRQCQRGSGWRTAVHCPLSSPTTHP